MNEPDLNPRFAPRAGLHNMFTLPEPEHKWVAFDLETRDNAPEDSSASYALGVTCVGFADSDGGPAVSYRGAGSVMTPAEVWNMSNELIGYSLDGYNVTTVNGAGFDFRVLAAECQDRAMFDNLCELALGSYDPAFQMLCEKGYMVGLDALAVGLELQERKTEGMTGVKAVEMWNSGEPNAQQEVLRYVEQDALVTLQIIQALESKRWTWEQYDYTLRQKHRYGNRQAVRWQTKKGKIAHHALEHGLLTVQECLELPLPDVEWMKKGGSEPWPRSKFTSWLQGEST